MKVTFREIVILTATCVAVGAITQELVIPAFGQGYDRCGYDYNGRWVCRWLGEDYSPAPVPSSPRYPSYPGDAERQRERSSTGRVRCNDFECCDYRGCWRR